MLFGIDGREVHAEVFKSPEHYELKEHDPGWYFWYVQPGCLPDSDPIGPFETEDEAVEALEKDATIE